MDRLAWMGLLLAVAACAPDLQTGGAGGAGGGSSSSGAAGMGGMAASSSSSTGGMAGVPCAADAECSALDTECQTGGTCVNGFCQWTFLPSGTMVENQVYGDCNSIVCDGNGNVGQSIDNTDKYVWGNPCYAPTCGTDVPIASNGVCTTKWGTSGKCQVDFTCRECTVDAACSGGTPICQNGKCVPTHCLNMVLDSASGETDVDCGVPCAPCDAGKTCNIASDCVGGGKCTGNPKTCQAPVCNDSIKNGDETGADCGGPCAMDPTNQKCPTNSGCLYPSDCLGGRCEAGVCK